MPGTGNTGNEPGNPPLSFAGGETGLNFGGGPGTGSGGTGSGPRNTPNVESKGCGCRVAGEADSSSTKLAWVGALFALGLAFQRRRSQRAPRV
jgi:MYXO-CTERM domain-containing protein